jgi:hypothetical protein
MGMNQLDVKRQQRENPRNSEKAGANAEGTEKVPIDSF